MVSNVSNVSNELFTVSTNINPDIYFHKSLVFLRSANYTNAFSFIDLAISVAPKKQFYMFQKIKMLFVTKQYTECSNYILNNILFFYKHCSLYIFSQILNYYQLCTNCSTSSFYQILAHNNIPAILADEYISIIHKEDGEFFKKALIAKEKEDYITCISYCDLLIQQNNNDVSIYRMKAECLHLLQKYVPAIDMYKKTLLLSPEDDIIHFTLGKLLLKLKQYTEAISYLTTATELSPTNIEYKSTLAETFYQWKKYDSALTYLKQIVDQEPSNINAYVCIADIYAKMHQPKNAKKYYKKANKLQSDIHFLVAKKKPKVRIVYKGIACLLLLLMVVQFPLFCFGYLPGKVVEFSAIATKTTIDVDESTELIYRYKLFPFYAKKNAIVIQSQTKDIADVIQNTATIKGLAPGKANFNVLYNDQQLYTFEIIVQE